MNTTDLLLIGGAAVAGWYFLIGPGRNKLQATPTPTPSGSVLIGPNNLPAVITTQTNTNPNPTGGSVTLITAAPGDTLGDIYNKILDVTFDANPQSVGLTASQFNAALRQVSNYIPPDPAALGFPSYPITLNQYWSQMAGWLNTHYGVSGLHGLMGWA